MAKDRTLREEIDRLSEAVRKLETRIQHLEHGVQHESVSPQGSLPPLLPANMAEAAENMEFRIGQFWFAKAGIVVLAIGILFLLTFPYQNLPPYLPSMMGYILVGIIFIISYLGQKSFALISRYLLGGGLLLLYFSTLRLHYFSEVAIIQNKTVLIFLLLFTVGFSYYVAIGRKSVYFASLAASLGYITAIVSEHSYALFMLLTLLSAPIVFLKRKFNWKELLIYGIICTYFVHFLWFINNPFLGHTPRLMASPESNLLFILLYMSIFALENLLSPRENGEDGYAIVNTFLNSGGGFSLFLLVTVTQFPHHLFYLHLTASFLLLAFSIFFWIREKSKYSTFIYAILGYTTLSVAIIAQFKVPGAFIWLCWQSLLVISTALWFRSKIIVLANIIIFLIIFLGYLSLAKNIGMESLGFGIVALLSGRIMNWKKHRLELKTEFMRNSYLTTAFFMIPYSLYHIVPSGYLGLSWVAVALFYYLISITLKNKKYRWMALLTLLLTVFYILIIGIARLDPVYRIISFMVLGVVLLITSIIYTRMKTKSGTDDKDVV